MRHPLAVLALLALPASAQVFPGHRLPEGPERPVREREIDIRHYRADLRFDMAKEELSGAATVTFTPLRAGLTEFSLDAADLNVRSVTVGGQPLRFSVDSAARRLSLQLPKALDPGGEASVVVSYSCRPKAGMYFFPKSGKRSAQAWNYGEGGLHYGWLPIYNDVNDRFTAELVVTVARPYAVLGNGTLKETRENADGTRTFHWVQEQPIPNYLLTVDVGEFARVPLSDAKVSSTRTVPLSVWTPPGTEAAAAHTFGETPKMVEFFSKLFDYPYPWAKYDQAVLAEFAVGAMETTTMTGFSEPHLHGPEDPPDGGPQYDEAYPTWTSEDTIAHELAHHWFGDLVTCRSLASIWLNESFASFLHTVWNGHAHGEDDLTYQRWRYLNKYLSYVRAEGAVRPLEFFRYKSRDDMFQTETTYLKGSLVLHMLRRIVGEADFSRALADYLDRHEFGSVDSEDLKEAFQKSCGKNLTRFFEDWIEGGGGHPAFDVSYRWVPERREVDLTVRQIHADLPFENDFRLPVDIEIVTASGAKTHRVEIEGWTTRVALPADGKPGRVVFDKGGWLVAEVKFERSAEELLEELARGDLAGKLRAARQLSEDFPRRVDAVDALSRVLADPAAHWGLRQEAALALGTCGGDAAAAALTKASEDSDRRIRRAAALALGRAGGERSAARLRRMVESDRAEDVVAAAEIALGRIGGKETREFLKRQLPRESRYWDSIRLGAVQGLAELRDPSLAPLFTMHTAPGFVQEVRMAALAGWFRAAPEDASLRETLRKLTGDRNRAVRMAAIEKLGALHHAADAELLKSLASDPDLAVAEKAKQGAEEIESFVKKPEGAKAGA